MPAPPPLASGLFPAAVLLRLRSRYTLPELGILTNPYLLGAIVISALLQLGVVTIPFVQPILEVSAHSTDGWLLIVGLSLVPVSVVEIGKMVLAVIRRTRPALVG
jgi:Ca2+-transporting ATPase